jgi:uncharacterized membrane protein YfcA
VPRRLKLDGAASVGRATVERARLGRDPRGGRSSRARPRRPPCGKFGRRSGLPLDLDGTRALNWVNVLGLAAAIFLLIGVVLGMLGGGGAILTLPMLVYLMRVDAKAAIATSLFVVGSTSLVGAAVHARAGSVQWRVGGIFGVAAMAGAFAGGRLARLVPGGVLLVVFAVVMAVTGVGMMRGRNEVQAREPRLARALALGAGVGVVSGLVGAGGGFMIVPALTLFGGLGMRQAVGTSLFVITLQSIAGFAGHVGGVDLDWTLVLTITGAAVVGSIVGASLARRLSPSRLRQGFAWLVVGMGAFMLVKQLPPAPAAVAVVLTILAVLALGRSPARAPRANGEGMLETER